MSNQNDIQFFKTIQKRIDAEINSIGNDIVFNKYNNRDITKYETILTIKNEVEETQELKEKEEVINVKKGRKIDKQKVNQKFDKLNIIYPNQMNEFYELLSNISSKIIIINMFKNKLPNVLGIDNDILWQSDWRIGLAAQPIKVSKFIDYYGLPYFEENVTIEDYNSLKRLMNKFKQENVPVFLIIPSRKFGSGLKILDIL